MPVMAMGVAELKRELRESRGFSEFPEIHSFLDGFYMSRIGIRILIGQHIALHEPPRKEQSGEILESGPTLVCMCVARNKTGQSLMMTLDSVVRQAGTGSHLGCP